MANPTASGSAGSVPAWTEATAVMIAHLAPHMVVQSGNGASKQVWSSHKAANQRPKQQAKAEVTFFSGSCPRHMIKFAVLRALIMHIQYFLGACMVISNPK